MWGWSLWKDPGLNRSSAWSCAIVNVYNPSGVRFLQFLRKECSGFFDNSCLNYLGLNWLGRKLNQTNSFQCHSGVMCLSSSIILATRLPSDRYFLYPQSLVLQSTEFSLLQVSPLLSFSVKIIKQKLKHSSSSLKSIPRLIGCIPWERIPKIPDSKQIQKHLDIAWEYGLFQGWHFLLQNKTFIGVLLDWYCSHQIK